MKITQKELKRLLNYSPSTGLFVWRIRPSNSWPKGSIAGTIKTGGYIQIGVKGIRYTAHRLAWLYMTGKWPKDEIDHKDGDPSNNRWVNLRDVTRIGNQRNKIRPHRNNKSRLLGVSKRSSGGYQARITVNRETFNLGTYKTAQRAHAAYITAKRKVHKTCTL